AEKLRSKRCQHQNISARFLVRQNLGRLWFYRVEAAVRGFAGLLRSETRISSHLVAQLRNQRVLEDIWDIVKDPNPNKYSATKERLLKIFVEKRKTKNQA
ncbi:hypothetical protein TNCV_2834811, partial [Trichonephila clavipes]